MFAKVKYFYIFSLFFLYEGIIALRRAKRRNMERLALAFSGKVLMQSMIYARMIWDMQMKYMNTL